jgi:rubrerythrin
MTDTKRTLKLLSTALEMEKKGKEFYDKAAGTCKTELGREIFSMLGRDEIIHLERIKTIYNSLEEKEEWTDEWMNVKGAHASIKTIFKDLVSRYKVHSKSGTSDLEALEVGIDFESKSVAFYEKEFEGATDAMEKKFAEKMIAEEKSHLSVLRDTKFYLTDPAAYFTEKEKWGLDGA